jgi:hypothetical protein
MNQANFKVLKRQEDLLRVKGLPNTTISEWKEDDVRTRESITYSSPYIEGSASK